MYCILFLFHTLVVFDLVNLIYLPILVNIIHFIILCLIKVPFKKYLLLIYLFIRLPIYVLDLCVTEDKFPFLM